MIGRLVLSDRNLHKVKLETKLVSARKTKILSHNHTDILVKTSKEFNAQDEYIKFNPHTNTIIEGLGQVGSDIADLDIYYHLFTNGWMSDSKYVKLWNEYIDINYDFAYKQGIGRNEYTNNVITIDPVNSIDLDDGFSFKFDNNFFHLDIHIADPVSWFDFSNPKFKPIFNEILNRLQSCYISKSNNPNPTHLLPTNIIGIISLLEIESNPVISLDSRRAISFCFKISKQTKQIVGFEYKFTNLTNIKNYTYENYDEFINLEINSNLKNELVKLSNLLADIIGLNKIAYPELLTTNNISHPMIEIFMILTNWWGGNYLLNKIQLNPILRVQDKNNFSQNFDISQVPEYARPFLSVSANYIETNKTKENEDMENYMHYSLEIFNYAHISSPMRRFVDMINHLGFYHWNLYSSKFFDENKVNWDLINTKIKNQKKISNAWSLYKFIKSNPELNKFRACLFDWIKNTKITGLVVLCHNVKQSIFIINVEIPQIEQTMNLTKYMEWNIELYYNSNNFKSTKFPFSIKII